MQLQGDILRCREPRSRIRGNKQVDNRSRGEGGYRIIVQAHRPLSSTAFPSGAILRTCRKRFLPRTRFARPRDTRISAATGLFPSPCELARNLTFPTYDFGKESSPCLPRSLVSGSERLGSHISVLRLLANSTISAKRLERNKDDTRLAIVAWPYLR